MLLSVALYFAEKLLTLPPAVDRVFDVIIVVGIAVQLAIWAAYGAALSASSATTPRQASDDAGARASVGVLMFVAQLVIWAVFVLLALDNLGINITALVAGIGIGGIAIALAVQTILGDLFGSLSIALDKPFAVGDILRIDDIEGTVEHIGIKSTRLRSVTGEQVILANADVLKSRVRNLGRMPERRVLFRLQVAYENESDKVEASARSSARWWRAARAPASCTACWCRWPPTPGIRSGLLGGQQRPRRTTATPSTPSTAASSASSPRPASPSATPRSVC